MTEVKRNWGKKNIRSTGLVFSNAFSPYEIKGLVEWKRGDLGITFGVSPAILSIADQSTGSTWTQSTVSAQPTQTSVATHNNQKGITFDGVQQFIPYTGVIFGSSVTIMTVSYPATTASTPFGGSGHTLGFLSQILTRWAWNNNTDLKAMDAGFNNPFVNTVRQVDGSTLVGRANGTQKFSVVPTQTLSGRQFLSVGADFNGTSFSNAPMLEMTVYNTSLSDNDTRRLEKYAGLRYQLTVS